MVQRFILKKALAHGPHDRFLVWFSLKKHQVHVDRRVVGWSAGRHVDRHVDRYVGGKFRHGLLEMPLTLSDFSLSFFSTIP